MIFKFLGGPIINKIVSTGVRYFEKLQEISEAKHTAKLEIEAKKTTLISTGMLLLWKPARDPRKTSFGPSK